ncbi:MAG: hypothetical protein F4Y24_14055 [Gemmatimonadetes bacterium]|nr:hypothetical protein [Gemmatimonadota bacterium]MYG21105.1 hypothetical protein [Gemmatimonadota bacterium]MYJ40183.1 hypothetical protein [Gemmatimonadota bacterium]
MSTESKTLFSRIWDFVAKLGGFTTGFMFLVGGLGYLMNFMRSRTSVEMDWPTVGALLSVIALAVAAGGLVLVLESTLRPAWRWYAPRRRAERFRQLAPGIGALTTFSAPGLLLVYGVQYLVLKNQLAALGVTLPVQRANALVLLDLAERSLLREARKRFPPGYDDAPPPPDDDLPF